MSTFTASYRGIGQLLRSSEMQAEMLRRAARAKVYAQATAPRETGQFATSFTTHVVARGGAHRDRAEAVLANTDPAGLAIELGTRRTPAHRTLRKALDAMRG